MKNVSRLVLILVMGLSLCVAASAQGMTVRKLDRASVRSAVSQASINAELVNSYYLGYDLESAKYLIRQDKTREALAQLAFLWDELYQQPEAPQVEMLIRMVVRGQGTAEQRIAKVDSARTAVEARLKAEHKWYYNVGSNYAQIFSALDAKDTAQVKLRMTMLGKLAKTPPVGTPAELVAAMTTIGQYGGKPQFSDGDIEVITAQFEKIDDVIAG